MSNKYTSHFNTGRRNVATPQTVPTPGRTDEVKNSAGGYVFKVEGFEQLRRFLILGSDGPTYYVSERKLTQDNAKNVVELIKTSGLEAVQQIVEISVSGRAHKNEPAIFALALATTFGNEATKQAAYAAISRVCRTGTHLFTFLENVQELRGWSRGLRNGVGKFYSSKEDEKLALQLVKYRQRNGWTHRDALRLAHVKPTGEKQAALLRWAVGKEVNVSGIGGLVEAFTKIQTLKTDNWREAVSLIKDTHLPWEALPTELLGLPSVWEALLDGMPLMAMVRNLGKMSSIGLLEGLNSSVKKVVTSLQDGEAIKRARLHPLFILNALKTYQQGHGMKGSLSWKTAQPIVDALDEAFYLAFDAVEPSGKNIMLGLDVSGSMGSQLGQLPLTCCEAATVMAMVTHRVEPWTFVGAFNTGFTEIPLSKKSTLKSAMKYTNGVNFGGTDCAMPMVYATKNKLEVDTFVVYTDNETYAGVGKPFQALKEYRQKMNRPEAKLVVVGMTSTGFTIADPKDKNMLDVVGFDTSTPQVLTSFSAGEI
jgi:60 kDa SS-A/Ro ribonucleoprotein